MKTTVGNEAYKRLINPDIKQGIIDTQREIDKNYFKEIEECIKRVKNSENFKNQSFFIVVITKKERLMENVIRRYFVPRLSLPTPAYDQTVWRYNKTGDLEFIWVVPDHNTCQEIYHNPLLVPKEEKWLKELVNMFMTGQLYHSACKQFNIPIDVDTEKPCQLVLDT